MTIDLALISLIMFFALLGALSGAAKQIANLVSLVAAYLCARPLGDLLGPRIALEFKMSLSVAIVAGTMFFFIVVMVATRLLLTLFLKRLFAGGDPDSRTVDRLLGLILGGMKVTLLVWFFLCALSFVEENVSIAGKKIGVAPKDSVAFKLAKTWNIFELQQFAPVRDLIDVAQALGDPNRASKLKTDPAFLRLQKDPRFKEAMAQQNLDKAFENGDYRALLKSTAVMKLIQDPTAAEQLKAAADKVE